MSEFKYACPVCGQHMKCDSSQSGSVSECPTCFKKIVVPQAPASEDTKFILAGSQYNEKKTTSTPAWAAAPPAALKKTFPLAFVGVLVLALAAVAALLVFHTRLFRPAKPGSETGAAAPHASDANWRLDLDAAEIPQTPVAGRIHGQDFILERAIFQNGTLTLREGRQGNLDFGVQINFSRAQPKALSGQSIHITADTGKAARVLLRWKEGGQAAKASFDQGYALRLDFGTLAGNQLPGGIYLCTPDPEKSYLLGTFTAEVHKPRPKPQPKVPPR